MAQCATSLRHDCTNIELVPDGRIDQSWRTTGLPKLIAASKATMHLLSALEGTPRTLNDSNLPDSHASHELVCMALTYQCRHSR
jgi:hypothetical protein